MVAMVSRCLLISYHDEVVRFTAASGVGADHTWLFGGL